MKGHLLQRRRWLILRIFLYQTCVNDKKLCKFAIGMDVFSKDKRSKIMAAIRSKNTRPELIVRKYLFAKGFRYRINHPHLPGHPDIVLRKYRTCIFVNGCFWHGHDCPKGHIPKTRQDFWRAKINRNRERDKEEQRRLAEMGWHCITVWECELAPAKREATLQSLEYTLNHIFLKDHAVTVKYQPMQDGDYGMAAEPEVGEWGHL